MTSVSPPASAHRLRAPLFAPPSLALRLPPCIACLARSVHEGLPASDSLDGGGGEGKSGGREEWREKERGDSAENESEGASKIQVAKRRRPRCARTGGVVSARLLLLRSSEGEGTCVSFLLITFLKI